MHNDKTTYNPFIDASGEGYVDENGVKYDVLYLHPHRAAEARRDDRMECLATTSVLRMRRNQREYPDRPSIKALFWYPKDGTMTVNVLVQADAIQAEGFADAKAAFAAFDAQAK